MEQKVEPNLVQLQQIDASEQRVQLNQVNAQQRVELDSLQSQLHKSDFVQQQQRKLAEKEHQTNMQMQVTLDNLRSTTRSTCSTNCSSPSQRGPRWA